MDKRSQKAAIKRIYKLACEYNHYEIQGWFEQDDKWCIASGYHFVRLNEKIDVENVPDAEGMNLNRFIGTKVQEVYVPSNEEIDEWIKDKITKNKPYVIADNKVNLHYVKDMLAILGPCNIYLMKLRDISWPVFYFESSIGDGVVLPVR